MSTTLILVRHGRTAWNKEERYRGLTDLPLDELGIRQAEAVGHRICEDYHPSAILVSPLQRTVKTAETMACVVPAVVQTHRGLLDLDYGDWTGLSHEEAKERYPELAEAWMKTPHLVRFPNGESLDDIRTRSAEVTDYILQNYPDQQVVAVTHLAVCRVLFCYLLDMPNTHIFHFRIDPASISVFEVRPWQQTTLVMSNQTSHLKGLG